MSFFFFQKTLCHNGNAVFFVRCLGAWVVVKIPQGTVAPIETTSVFHVD